MDLTYIPHYHYKRVTDITVSDVLSWGVGGIALDIDNTLCYDATTKYIGEAEKWINGMKKSGIPMCIVSNGNISRVVKIGKKLGLPYIGLAGKPKKDAFLKGAELLGLDVSDVAFIGDQIFSDVKGANTAGAVSVFVEPPSREIIFFFFYRIRRYRERPYVAFMNELEEKTGIPHTVRRRENKRRQ